MDVMDRGRRPKVHSIMEMYIPGSKVGLVIGKGGKNIRLLEGLTDVKLLMIRDSNGPNETDRILLITGEPSNCQLAKEMVLGLLDEDLQGPGGGGMVTFNNFDDMLGGRDGPGGTEDPPGGPLGGPMGPGTGGPGPQGPQGPGPQGPGGFELFGQYGQPNQPPQQYGALQGWNVYGIQYQMQPSGPSAADIQAQVTNPVALMAYYPQYYVNYGQYGQYAQQIQLLPYLQQPAGQSYALSASVSPAINLQTGQPGYSAQLGMYHQAYMFLQQAPANAATAVAVQPQQQQPSAEPRSNWWRDLKHCLRTVLAFLLSTRLACRYNYFGLKGKKSLSGVRTFLKTVYDAMRVQYPEGTDSLMWDIVSNWLAGSRDRDQGRKERDARRTQQLTSTEILQEAHPIAQWAPDLAVLDRRALKYQDLKYLMALNSLVDQSGSASPVS